MIAPRYRLAILAVAIGAAATRVHAQQPEDRNFRADCTGCHTRAHDLVLGRDRSANARCAECHEKVHPEYKQIEAFYGGAKTVPPRPDPMSQARVDCADCHADTTLAVKGPARIAALDRVCTTCHGRRFSGMLARWDAGIRWRVDSVGAYVDRARADGRVSGSAPARSRLSDAKTKLAVIAAGGGLHNVRGSDALLRDAVDITLEAYTAAGVQAPPAPALGSDAAGVTCIGCHYGIEAAKDTAFGRPFDHGSHVLRGNVACTKCHSDASFLLPAKPDVDIRKREIDPKHGKTTIARTSCNECHHSPTATAACSSCHRTETLPRYIAVSLPLKLTPKNAPKFRDVHFDHGVHSKNDCATCHASKEAVRTVVACATCHSDHHTKATQCASCHGQDTRAAHKAQDHFSCASCHAKQTAAGLMPDRAFCVSCHVKQADHKPDRECSTCHMQSSPADLRKRMSGGR